MRDASVRADARVEGQGATLGEAKWAAMKTLERSFPGVESDHVRFDGLDEGDESGGGPARGAAEGGPRRWEGALAALRSERAERVRALLARVALAFELRASVDIEETDEEIRATVN